MTVRNPALDVAAPWAPRWCGVIGGGWSAVSNCACSSFRRRSSASISALPSSTAISSSSIGFKSFLIRVSIRSTSSFAEDRLAPSATDRRTIVNHLLNGRH